MYTYDKGDLVRVSAEFYNAAGELQDPTNVYFAFKDPSGNKTSYHYGEDAALVRDDEGQYHVDIDADETGIFYHRFYGTGTGQSAREGKFKVAESVF